jgi:thioredoxin 2
LQNQCQFNDIDSDNTRNKFRHIHTARASGFALIKSLFATRCESSIKETKMNENKLTLVCQNCLSVNRVPVNRISDRPICGKCQQALLPGTPVELTDRSFNKFIARTAAPVLVDFWASWCGPCRMMAPSYAEAAAELSPQFILAKLDTEAAPQTASRFSLSGIPTIILFRDGQEVARQSGAMNTPQIVQWALAGV